MNNALEYTKKNATAISDADRRVWELLTDVPKLHWALAYGLALLNVFFSGCGTMVSSFLGEGGLNKTQLFVGLFQFLTSVYFIGWVLSVYWGFKLIMKASRTEEHRQLITPGEGGSHQSNNPYAVMDN